MYMYVCIYIYIDTHAPVAARPSPRRICKGQPAADIAVHEAEVVEAIVIAKLSQRTSLSLDPKPCNYKSFLVPQGAEQGPLISEPIHRALFLGTNFPSRPGLPASEALQRDRLREGRCLVA